MPFPSLKLGPGDSARSHTADEYIRLTEIAAGIEGYISLLSALQAGELPDQTTTGTRTPHS